jgi:BlaI family transcriptional regulator, penicillinase repressor
MKKIPRISESEWEVMRALWEKGPSTASEVIAALPKKGWHPKTVKTLLGRLVKKKAAGFVEEGRTYIYRALVSEKECAAAESASFLERVFGGSLQPMLAHFVERQKLSAEEIRELKRILDRK